MRRNRSPLSNSPFRALAHHQQAAGATSPLVGTVDPATLIRSFNVETNPARPIRPSPLTASTIRDMPLELFDRIRSFPLFSSAPDDFLAAVGARLRPQIHAAHDHILTEGDDAKAMYWLVRGVVAVTSRDGEAVYATLTPGAFFGEIGVLMDVPRTATIVARSKCLLVVLMKEDLLAELPKYPDMERAIMHEAQERLSVLKKKRQEDGGPAGSSRPPGTQPTGMLSTGSAVVSGIVSGVTGGAAATTIPMTTTMTATMTAKSKMTREAVPGEIIKEDSGIVNSRKRKSPSPGVIEDPSAGSALGSGLVNIRKTLKELPLFSKLPPDILHFLGLSAQPKTYSPFANIVRQGNPGNEIFFIVRGEAEVIHETPESATADAAATTTTTTDHDGVLRALLPPSPRLRQGQYFGEVASLGMSPGRTATVRAITTVECLMIGGEALDELWKRCSPDLRREVEETARRRYQTKARDRVLGEDVIMTEAEDPPPVLPRVTFAHASAPAPEPESSGRGGSPTSTLRDPDPFLSVDMENLRNRRRNSLAPPPGSDTAQNVIAGLKHTAPPLDVPARLSSPGLPTTTAMATATATSTATAATSSSTPTPTPTLTPASTATIATTARESPHEADAEEVGIDFTDVPAKRQKLVSRERSPEIHPDAKVARRRPALLRDDNVLLAIFSHLPLADLIALQAVSRPWRDLLRNSPRICVNVDLRPYNLKVTDQTIASSLAPFIGERPEAVDISNCFHITDEGFATFWRACGRNVRRWRMRSVWDVSANQILEMSGNAKGLEEVDWSNCRKVGDNLLLRVVGWVVPQPTLPSNASPIKDKASVEQEQPNQQQNQQQEPASPPTPHSTVVGCPKLSSLNLSYCKHITDRSMAHLAAHASQRLRSLTLTRCTSITDNGFLAWTPYHFPLLQRLCLADCTYLTDSAVVSLVNAAKNLTHLDLSFCCALSDTATEVVALGLPRLRELRLAFCGSAVSDGSLGGVALHLNELEGISVRGCVRVTGRGVDSLVDGCKRLAWVDISQCRNLEDWVKNGGVETWGGFGDREAGGGGAPEVVAGKGDWDGNGFVAACGTKTAGVKGSKGSKGGGEKKATAEAAAEEVEENEEVAERKGADTTTPVTRGLLASAVTRSNTTNGGLRFPAAEVGGGGARRLMRPMGLRVRTRRPRKPIRFIIEKGPNGLR